MKGAVLFVLLALVVGMLVGDRRWGEADAQVRPIPFVPRDAEFAWPPRAWDVVNMGGEIVTSTPDEIVPVYSVPQEKWFVLTSFFAVNAGGFDLVELYAGTETVKTLAGFVPHNDLLGLAFRPGSEVGLRYPSSASNHQWNFSGYLSRGDRQRLSWPPLPQDILNLGQQFYLERDVCLPSAAG